MFDFSSPLFWYRLVFLAELIVAEALFTFKLRRRPYFVLRIALSVVAIYGVTFLLPIVAYNAFYVSFMFLLMFGMTIAGLYACFDAPLLNVVFCAIAAYSVQHIAYEAYTFLTMAFGLQTAPGGPYEQTSRHLFGYGSTDKGFVYSGGGSSGTFINMDRASDEDIDRLVITPREAFEAEGFEVNKELMKFYTDFSTYNATVERGINTLYQPKADAYSADVIRQARSFSGVAVVVISRNGTESSDVPLYQRKNNGAAVTDNTRTYLQLTTEEEGMLDIVTDNFDKVIVLLNTASPIDTGFLEDKGIDAAMYVGIPGQSGTLAIPRLLKGYKTEKIDDVDTKVAATPSGRLADTYAYSVRAYAPTDANMYAVPATFGQITYAEGIYFGYKWYETANAEGYFDNVTTDYGRGYDGVVQYPFGYGLSYDTDFKYTVTSSLSDNANITADTKLKITVTVENSASATATGKDVVQLYYTPPYYDGEIEKSEVNLLAFAKTRALAPGQSQTFEFDITPYDMACYDDYGRNPGAHTGYELDRGDYTISLRTDAHTLADCEKNELKFKVAETINIDKDPVTGEDVVNRFTGEDAYLDLPIDGSTAGGDAITYLSRADLAGTYPKKRTADRSNKTLLDSVNTAQNDRYDTETMPSKKAEYFFVVKR